MNISRKLQQGLDRLGLAGTLGLGLLVFGAALYLGGIAPAARELAATQARVETLKAQQDKPRPAGGVQQVSQLRERDIQAFLQAFPPMAQAPEWLEKIYEAAERQHVELPHGDYEMVVDKHINLTHYRLNLPVRGTYPQLRNFLLEVLNDVPTLALDSINFQKEKIGDRMVTAQIRLTLHMGRP